jgi:GT2 family glycosyltransferase
VKLLEAFAMGAAVITTSIGAAGFPVVHGQHAMIADTPEEFRTAVAALISSSDLRARLGKEARQMILDRFTWDTIGREFLRLVEERDLSGAVIRILSEPSHSFIGSSYCCSSLPIGKETVTPKIDVLVVLYNSANFIQPLLDSIRRITTPVTLYFLDNASRDGTADKLGAALVDVPFRTYFLRSLSNNGFARGINLLARQGQADFIFILNPDTELEEGCLERLLDRAINDPTISMCEARQQPREHPKAYDPRSGETTWCTGAAVLIRRKAFEEVGGFDERIFFMYCEDVDLSWKLWLRGWKCIYVPDAIVRHTIRTLFRAKRERSKTISAFAILFSSFTDLALEAPPHSILFLRKLVFFAAIILCAAGCCTRLLLRTTSDIFRISFGPDTFGVLSHTLGTLGGNFIS